MHKSYIRLPTQYIIWVCMLRNILNDCTPNQKLACFVLYLKIINTFLENNICILKQMTDWLRVSCAWARHFTLICATPPRWTKWVPALAGEVNRLVVQWTSDPRTAMYNDLAYRYEKEMGASGCTEKCIIFTFDF